MNRSILLLLFLVAVFSCSKKNSSVTGPDGQIIVTYRVEGNKIIVQSLGDTLKYCIGDSLATTIIGPEEDTTEFLLEGNTLKLLEEKDSLFSGTIVQYFSRLQRVGSGTGLLGNWTGIQVDYAILSGTPTPEELEELEQRKRDENSFYKNLFANYSIRPTTIYGSIEINYSMQIIDRWNREKIIGKSDSALYDVTLSALSQFQVRLVGNKNKETVHIEITKVSDKFFQSDNRTYTSTDASHAEYTYYGEAVTCPNPVYPTWWQTGFLNPNRRDTAEMAQREPKQGFTHIFRKLRVLGRTIPVIR